MSGTKCYDDEMPPCPGIDKVMEEQEEEVFKKSSPSASVGSEQDSASWEQVHIQERSYKDPLRELHPSTAVIYAGYHSNLSEQAIKPPIFKSSTFVFSSAEEGELFFKRAYGLEGNDGKAPGLVYSRLNNPNTEILEDKMVSLEQGSRYCNAFPSGMSAISTTIMALVPTNGHILYTNPVYGGTYFFLKDMCPERLGVTSEGIDTSNSEKLRTAIEQAHRLDVLYLESPANPTLSITDIALATSLAKAKNPNCLVMVDNTFMGPVFQSPFLFGVDVVLYSATKFIGGHSDLIAGLVLTKEKDLMAKINAYRTILGPVISPDTAWMLTRSVETVWLRMERQAQKAQKVASDLAAHPRVTKLLFPGSYVGESSNMARAVKTELWQRQCTGTGSMIAIVVRPNTRKAAFTVLNAMKIAHLAVSLGSTETLVEHPRSMTHSDMTVEDLDACGIEEGMLRISIGLESSKDISKDLLGALDMIQDDEN
ncbi:cystathionine beta-lyase/cystathionine gamma-synthase [Nitzschia inconspicua]|uniref:Cystathionine beta-lyase/cystathionine gamma-synthase n=1 Tax=Nitzschia inconspicua TaxID=303405 RepID=A0A9K3L2J0_9STRA|nr:cystathionine beta-lyase/cystathionine gamma-synthase [Nitzschia inconspicua]